jgi:hypothetical protein
VADRTVRVIITGDSTSAEAAFLKLDAAAAASGISLERHSVASVGAAGKTKELGTAAEQTAGAFQKDLRGSVDDIANAFGSKFGPASGTATTAVRSMGNEILGASGVMKVAAGAAVVGGVAILGLGAYALSSVSSWAALGEKVLAFQRVSGTTAEEASRLIYVMGELGISSDTASAAMFKMTRADPGKLHELGVEIAYNADGSKNLAGTLDNVRAAYQATQDPAQRSLILFTAFGKAGQALAPYLAMSAEQLRVFNAEASKYHAIFTQPEVDQAHEYTLATRAMSAAMEGFGHELAQAVIPALTATVKGVTSLTESVDHTVQTATKSKEAHAGLTIALDVLSAAWNYGTHAAEGFAMSLVNTVLSPLKLVWAGAKDVGSAVSTVAFAVSSATGIHINFGSALSSTGHFLAGLIPGLDNATSSTKKHSDASKEAATAEDKVTQANIDATQGIYALSSAQIAGINALSASRDVTDKGSESTLALAQNVKDLAKQQDTLTKSVSSFIDPMKAYDDLMSEKSKQATADAKTLTSTEQQGAQDRIDATKKEYSDKIAAARAYGVAHKESSTAIVKTLTDQRDATVNNLEDEKKGYKNAADSVSVSVAEWMGTLEKQVKDQQDWELNMVLLASRASAGTIQYLAEMGVKGSAIVGELVNSSDSEMNRLNQVMNQKSKAASDVFIGNFQDARPMWEAVMRQGGQGAVDSLTAQLRAGTITVDQISHQYGVSLAAGINPILASLGKAQIDAMAFGGAGPRPMAFGGWVSGEGGPRDDRVPILASNGEFVVNAKAAENNRAALEWMNAAKFADGGYVDGSSVPRPPSTNPFRLPISTAADDVMQREYDEAVKWVNENAGGGLPEIKAWIQAQSGKPYVWGGGGPGGYDCSGYTGAVYGLMTKRGGGQGQRYFTTLSDFHALGFADGPGGTYTIGVSPSHMVGRYGGLPFEAGHTPIVAGPGAQNTAHFPRQYHMGGNGPGQGVGAGSGGMWLGDSGTPAGGAKGYAQSVLNARGWGDQFGALDFIFTNESNWDPGPGSINPSSGAYGIPQANPSGGQGHPYALGDWRAQVDWGINYIAQRYGDPNGAAAFWRSHNWYDQGGILPPGTTLATNATGQNEYILNQGQMASLGARDTGDGTALLDEIRGLRFDLRRQGISQTLNFSGTDPRTALAEANRDLAWQMRR